MSGVRFEADGADGPDVGGRRGGHCGELGAGRTRVVALLRCQRVPFQCSVRALESEPLPVSPTAQAAPCVAATPSSLPLSATKAAPDVAWSRSVVPRCPAEAVETAAKARMTPSANAAIRRVCSLSSHPGPPPDPARAEGAATIRRAERSGDSLLLQCPWRLLARESPTPGHRSGRAVRRADLGPSCLVKFVREWCATQWHSAVSCGN